MEQARQRKYRDNVYYEIEDIQLRMTTLKDALMFLSEAKSGLFIEYFQSTAEMAASYSQQIINDLEAIMDGTEEKGA